MAGARHAVSALVVVVLCKATMGAARTSPDNMRMLSETQGTDRSLQQQGTPSPMQKPQGRVIAWGTNAEDDGEYAGQATVPTDLAGPVGNVVAIAAGKYHSLALLSTGEVRAWGSNSFGQGSVPPSLSDVISVAAGGNNSVALRSDGTVVAWGYNSTDGETAVPPGLANVTQVAVGCNHTLVLHANGKVTAWGYKAAVPPGLSGVVEVACGCFHSLARLRNGSAVAWGHSHDNRTAIPPGLFKVQGVAGGLLHSLIINGGAVIGLGDNEVNQTSPIPPKAQSNVVKVAAGGWHSLALLNNGQLVGWGYGGDGQLSIPLEALSNVLEISAGFRHSMALVQVTASPPPEPPPSPPTPPPPPPPPPATSSLLPDLLSPPSPAPPPGASTPLISSAADSSSSSNTPVIVGVVVGAVGGVLLLAALIVGVVWWRKKHTAPPQASTGDAWAAVSISVTKPGDAGMAGSTHGSPKPAPSPHSGTEPSTASAIQATHSRVVSSAPSNTSTAVDVTHLLWENKLKNLEIRWEELSIDDDAVLGQGGFGTVLKGTWQGTIPVAVKMLRADKLTPRALEEMRNEALIMCDMHHPAIATVYGLVDDGTHHALVMRLYQRGSVAGAISRPRYEMLSLARRLNMAQQVASGMQKLHERQPAPIIHGDLKTSNLLVDDDGKSVVIADFGLACCLREGQSGQVIEGGFLTLHISPPEVLENPKAPRTTAGDVYAFGVVLMEIVTGRPAFNMCGKNIIAAVTRGLRPDIPAEVPADVASIITACWAQDAAARPTFAEVVAWLTTAIANVPKQQYITHPGSIITLADLTTAPYNMMTVGDMMTTTKPTTTIMSQADLTTVLE